MRFRYTRFDALDVRCSRRKESGERTLAFHRRFSASLRAARHTDLPLPRAGAAEQGATAAGGDSMF